LTRLIAVRLLFSCLLAGTAALCLAAGLSPLSAACFTLPLLVATVVTWMIVEITRALGFGRHSAKSHREMTDRELRAAHRLWTARIAESSGWGAMLFAVEQVESIKRESDRRSLRLESNDSNRRCG
jgi:hypothetical protein